MKRFEASKEKLQQELDMYMEREKKITGSHEQDMKSASDMNQRLRNKLELKETEMQKVKTQWATEVCNRELTGYCITVSSV